VATVVLTVYGQFIYDNWRNMKKNKKREKKHEMIDKKIFTVMAVQCAAYFPGWIRKPTTTEKKTQLFLC
jgi:undecaprenyl pyrophosphate phosphatase UppP